MVSEELTREFFHTRDERLIRKLSEISQVISYKRGEEIYAIGEAYTYFFILIRILIFVMSRTVSLRIVSFPENMIF